MLKFATFLLTGLLFGTGISISGMINPAKVLNFFDVFGTWDPSLIFVMGGALITTAIGYRIVFGYQARPLLAEAFRIPSKRTLDVRLIAGSATFGIGWGIAGFCPGGAIPALGLGSYETFVFIVALMVGIMLARAAEQVIARMAVA